MRIDKTLTMKRWVLAIVMGLIAFVMTGSVYAQDIVPLGQFLTPRGAISPQEAVVCEGGLVHQGDGSYRCSGQFFNAEEYAAKYAALSDQQLGKLNASLDKLNASLDKLNGTSGTTQDILSKQVQAFNSELRAYIEKRFQDSHRTMFCNQRPYRLLRRV